MTRKRTPTPPATPYRPRSGELVQDQRTGRLGAYMETRGGEAYLRPPEGGTEWTTTPANVAPLDGAIVVHIVPSKPRSSADAA
ncbi:hypothetical protein [Streptomyces sp. MJM8645]|uniref:hypothetical protein n=1 Tax=Streptomycetaceae TaxID=2062 RepID=UPI0007AFA2E7|nr:hypothetical protein [Streptomyces sp. MJM8645]